MIVNRSKVARCYEYALSISQPFFAMSMAHLQALAWPFDLRAWRSIAGCWHVAHCILYQWSMQTRWTNMILAVALAASLTAEPVTPFMHAADAAQAPFWSPLTPLQFHCQVYAATSGRPVWTSTALAEGPVEAVSLSHSATSGSASLHAALLTAG